MPIQTDGPAPYTAPKAVTDFVTAYRTRGLQTPFTPDVLIRAGVAETLVPRTVHALKLLGLIDDEAQPTQEFVDIRKAPEAEFKDRFAALVRAAYAEVFSYVDPAEDPPERIRDAFRPYTPVAQQDRMVALFLGLCEFAGIIPEGRRRAAAAVSRPRRETRSRPQAEKAPKPSVKEPTAQPATPTEDAKSAAVKASPSQPGGQAAGSHPLIQGLLRELPPIGATWTETQRNAWIDLAGGILRVLYTIKTDAPDDGGEVRLSLTSSSKEGRND